MGKTLSSTIQERLQALQQNRFFFGLEENLIKELAHHTQLYHYARYQNVLWESEPCPGLFIVRSGRIKLYKSSQEGREMIIKVMEDGDTFNEVPVFDHQGNPINATALEPSQLWLVQTSAIRDLIAEHSQAALNVITNLSQNLRMLVDLATELSFNPVTLRMANFLLDQAPEILAGNQALEITQNQLASQIGTVREVAARSLRKLEEAGALQTSRGKIILIDTACLANWE